jgi:hypothetical protein
MQYRIGRRTLLAAAGSALAFPAIRARAQTAGVALVIGNSKYQWEAPLPNVRRDAPDIARRLQAFGLRTELVQDVGRDAMRRAIDTLLAAARGANLAAVYFAGHGAAWAKETYLVPVDADLSNPNTVDNLIHVAPIQTGMDAASNRLFIFDNCRNNPADGWRQREADDAAIQGDAGRTVLPNTLTMFSTAPGRVALDGPAGENSPFAAALLRQFDSGSVDLLALPGKLRRELLMATRAQQVLWDRNSYTQSFVLTGAPARTAVKPGGWAADPASIIELNNASAFAQQNGLRLLPRLIAHRPPASSPHGTKVGAYRFDSPTPGGRDGIVPGILVVMSVEGQDGAEIIFVRRVGGQGGFRFVRADLSGDTLDYTARAGGQRLVFKWSDANTGSVVVFPTERSHGSQRAPYSGRFTRLDG